MIEQYVASLSSYSADIDFVIILIGVMVGFWLLLAEGLFFGFIFKYRAKDGVKADYITGEEKELNRPISWAHTLILLCDVCIVYFAVIIWVDVKQNLPEADATINVIGQQWAWTFEHPGPDGQIDTEDDIRLVDELHLEVGKTYHYKLSSKDVLHSFSVPVFRLKQDAIPGRIITGWFKPTGTGAHDIQCAEICGIGHGMMGARVLIEVAETHAAWVQANSTPMLADNTPEQGTTGEDR
jgi:cytochrome c oxidase subunit 2